MVKGSHQAGPARGARPSDFQRSRTQSIFAPAGPPGKPRGARLLTRACAGPPGTQRSAGARRGQRGIASDPAPPAAAAYHAPVTERVRHARGPLTGPEIAAHNELYVREQFVGLRPLRPAREMAVVACMDSRMAVFSLLGLEPGDAHIIRNAGGVVTDDVIRSLVLSQRVMGTRGIVIVQHTDCGLTKISEDQMRADLEAATGVAPRFVFEAFRDPFANVRQSMRRLYASPFLLYRDEILGYVYDVATGRMNQVKLEA